MNARKQKHRLVSGILLVLFLSTLLFTLIFVLNPINRAFGATNPEWCGDYKVGISFDEEKHVKETTLKSESNGYVSNVAIPKIVCGIPGGASANEVKVRVRTKDGTAVAGVDYTAIDTVATLRRNSFTTRTSGQYYYDSINIKVETGIERMIVNGQRPYFDIEIYDVLDENFSIAEGANSVRVYVASVDGKEHYYNVADGFDTQFLDGYLTSDYKGYGTCPNLNIYSEDKSGQTLSASQDFNGRASFTNDYKKTGLADYFVGVNLHLDEKGVSLSSTCTLDLYDGSTSGTHLYHSEFWHIWNDSLDPGIYYEDMKHKNESFAESPDSFIKSQHNVVFVQKACYIRIIMVE